MNSQGETSNADTGDLGTGEAGTDNDTTDESGTDGTTDSESGVSVSAASLVRAIEDRLGIKNSGGDEASEAPDLAERPEVGAPELPGAEFALPDVETPDEIHLDRDIDLNSELDLDHEIPDDDTSLDRHQSPTIDASPAAESTELIGDDPTIPLATTAVAATSTAKTARAPWANTKRRPVRSPQPAPSPDLGVAPPGAASADPVLLPLVRRRIGGSGTARLPRRAGFDCVVDVEHDR